MHDRVSNPVFSSAVNKMVKGQQPGVISETDRSFFNLLIVAERGAQIDPELNVSCFKQ